MNKLAVFCASRTDPKLRYLDSFNQLADEFIDQKIDMIYGGANVGYMKVLADRIAHSPSKLIGIMPEFLKDKELAYELCDEFITVKDLPSRILRINEEADGFVVMPGGVGTYEELMDMLSWSQVGLHHKPTLVVNVDGFFDGTLLQLTRGVEDELISKSIFDSIYFTDDIVEGLKWMNNLPHLEYWDIYDEQGNQTAIVHPGNAQLSVKQFHKVSVVVLVDDNQQILIQKRAAHINHPNLWDYSAGGAVVTGETPIMAANRETYEELGIHAAVDEGDLLFEFTHRQSLFSVYLKKYNVSLNDLDFSVSREVTEAKWVSIEELSAMIREQVFVDGPAQLTIMDKLDEKLS